jgi:cytochrome c oxidase cbb3-type subunit 3
MAEKDELLDSNYDGIQEYDNDLPLWWIYLFVLTVVFAVVYVVWLHFGGGLDQEELFAADMRAYREQLARLEEQRRGGEASVDVGSVLLALAKDSAVLRQGENIYLGKCMACHAQQGQGLVGPNLTDDYWIHGGLISDLRTVILNGVPEKGMLSWRGILKDEEINAVTAYVWTLHGTNPPNPKKPEGELVKR